MRLCNEARVGVVPVGGNTGYCGGATPSEDGSQIVLSLARMRRDPFGRSAELHDDRRSRLRAGGSAGRGGLGRIDCFP